MLQMDAVCDQGCRPVGQAATVTSSHGGTILQLDHQTALLVVSLPSILPELSATLNNDRTRLHCPVMVY